MAFPNGRWLSIYTRAKAEQGTWEVVDPSLETTEVSELATWFSAPACGRPRRRETEFTEPNVCFRRAGSTGNELTLRVYFELKPRPRWAYSASAGRRDVWLDLSVLPEALRTAAASLVRDLVGARRRRHLAP